MPRPKLVYFFSQPHQPFFALGLFNALAVMLLFIPAFRGMLSIDARLLHAYGMIFLVFTNFFYGFTYTTFTRFSAQPPIEERRYLRVWVLNLLAALSFYVSLWMPPLFYVAALLMALSFAYTLRIFMGIYAKAPEPKKDQYWIIVGFGMGALADLLFLLAQIPCRHCRSGLYFDMGVEVGIYLYLIFLPAVIAFRMVPHFSRCMNYRKSRGFDGVLLLLLLAHVLLSQAWPKGLFAVDLLAALWLGRELWRMELPFPNPDPLLWGLHLALFWLPLGFLAGAAVEFFEAWFGYASLYLPLHLLVLGFLTTIMIAFGTRVTLGHGGAVLGMDRWGAWLLWMTQVVVLGRLALSLAAAQGSISPWFDISATLWIVLFVLWTAKYGKILVRGAR
ncbi:NnrS family protein [Nitratifractor salsuginis]|uniref:NnrS family protein n=1 Tax=Nitratifractor salsuginis (strain DSM 16511 / JCM 12458 / E9I37-1) TaxID=749222 RepID=E6WZS6_NITSE|nr:NnrS family protein [Nitratifractor salsuginis]ADV46717.1 NnrS family protein [Nitratifractor salsuginis DSM 16511]